MRGVSRNLSVGGRRSEIEVVVWGPHDQRRLNACMPQTNCFSGAKAAIGNPPALQRTAHLFADFLGVGISLCDVYIDRYTTIQR